AGGPGMRTYLRHAGSEPVLLASGRGTSLSADGQWVLVTPPDRSGPIQIVPVGPGAVEGLPAAVPGARSDPCWFPDGKRIAYTGVDASGRPRIYVQERGAQAAAPVGPIGLRMVPQGISPDGTLLLATDRPSYYVVPVAGGAPRGVKLENEEVP